MPEQVIGGLLCTTDLTGHASVQWQPPSLEPGVVVFKADAAPTDDGLDAEIFPSGVAYARVAGDDPGANYTVDVTGPPSTPCGVSVAFSPRPANTDITNAESKTGRTGRVEGTTCAFLDGQPAAGAQSLDRGLVPVARR